MYPLGQTARIAFAAALAVAASASGSIVGADASCAPPEPISQRITRADAIVFGRVESFVGPPASVRSAFFVTVQRVYKGSVVDRIVLSADPRGEGGGLGQVTATSVDYQVERGSEHTFYLKQHAPAGFSTDSCSGSHPGDLDPDERSALGAGAAPDRRSGGPGSVTGPDRALAIATVVAVLGATFLVSRAVLAGPR